MSHFCGPGWIPGQLSLTELPPLTARNHGFLVTLGVKHSFILTEGLE